MVSLGVIPNHPLKTVLQEIKDSTGGGWSGLIIDLDILGIVVEVYYIDSLKRGW